MPEELSPEDKLLILWQVSVVDRIEPCLLTLVIEGSIQDLLHLLLDIDLLWRFLERHQIVRPFKQGLV